MRKILLLCLSLFLFIFSYAQQVVSGHITDEKGMGIEGISVREKGAGGGTTTDKEGYFTLKVSNANAILIFSGVGFNEKEVSLTGKKSVDVTLTSSAVTLGNVEMVGTRSPKRSATETAVPVDIIPISKIADASGMVEINSILQYVAPSFNSNRQSGADGADHIDPATIRGMGPDQTLVLVNGKRWHQSSLVNLYGSRGRGNTGTDLNAIPAAAIERIEILRDGASAQYGSDAIAGVINIILKQSVKDLTINASVGEHITGYGSSLDSDQGKVLDNTSDGLQYNANMNYGFKLKEGFVNLTGDFLRKNKTYRPNYSPLYPDNYRSKFGDGSYNNYSAYLNNTIRLNNRSEFYSFGGVNYRNGDAFAWTRNPGSERNVTAIYPNGFDPHIQSKITDLSWTMGLRVKMGVWNMDLSGITGSNRFHFEVDKTLNASLEENSPTHFDAGGFQLSQNTANINFSRAFSRIAKGLNLAMGAEVRYEQYQIFAGETASWKQYGPVVFSIDGTDTTFRPGGSQGFPGFQPKDEVRAGRNNVAAYIDAELDVSEQWMVGGAVRAEHYSDFGFTENFKVVTRVKTSDFLSLRGSYSTGFRAPSLPQVYFSSTFTNVVAGQIVDQVIAPNRSPLAKAVGIPKLKEETSSNLSYGFVARPFKGFTLTVDGYHVKVKDRIVLTGLFTNDDDAIGQTLQEQNVGAAQFFTNAVSTTTDGVDIITTYNTRLLGQGRLNVTVAANFNSMKIDNIRTTAKLEGKEDVYFGPRERAFLIASAPDHKIGLTLDYTISRLNAMIRLTHFSSVNLTNWNDDTDHYDHKLTTDVAIGVKITPNLHLTIGGNNILDVYPDHHDPGLTETGGMWDAVQMGYGGAFYFVKLGFRLPTK